MTRLSMGGRRHVAAVLLITLATGATAGCEMSKARAQTAPAASVPPPADPAVVTFGQSAKDVIRPDGRLSLTVSGGTLSKVTATTAGGHVVPGVIDPAGSSWGTKNVLPDSTQVTVKALAQNADGVTTTKSATFTMLSPRDTEKASITPLTGSTVGIAMPIVVNFGTRIANKAAVERRLKVSATPGIEGSWNWISGREVQYRPAQYWPAGTRVTVTADLAGVQLADGVWGKNRKPVNFTIGRANVNVVNIADHTLTVRTDGQVLRTIPVTTGKDGLATRNGIKVIMSQERTHRMDASTTGVEKDDPEYYNLVVGYAQRLTYSGEFFHAAPWSAWAHGKQNVSHGCTGMSTQDARWLMAHSQVGDPVEFVGGSRALEDGNGWTLWNTSYEQWRSGSALS